MRHRPPSHLPRSWQKYLFAFFSLLLWCGASQAAVFTVNSTGDQPDASLFDNNCSVASGPSGSCTLRAAIEQANATTNGNDGPDYIVFNIPGGGTQTIAPKSPLPSLAEAVVIDGYTQPESAINERDIGTNAQLRVEIDGSQAGSSGGISIGASSCAIRGLSMYKFASSAINITSSVEITSDVSITGCFLGVKADGSSPGTLGSSTGVRIAELTANCRVGSDSQGALRSTRNLISNNLIGVQVLGGLGHQIVNNLIGTDKNGLVATGFGNSLEGVRLSGGSGHRIGAPTQGNIIRGNSLGISLAALSSTQPRPGPSGVTIQSNTIGQNGLVGITLNDASDNKIGGLGSSQGNEITDNQGDGVIVNQQSGGVAINNSILSNSITRNSGLGIRLYASGTSSGVTVNDPGDTDTGPNLLQNYPIVTFNRASSPPAIEGTLNSTPSSAFTVQLFVSDVRNISRYGEGQSLLQTLQVATNAQGVATFSIPAPSIGTNQYITATATDSNGNTSEFGPAASTGGVSPTPTPVPTATATATATPSPTPTLEPPRRPFGATISKRAITDISPEGYEVATDGTITYILRFENTGYMTLNNVVVVDGAPLNTRINGAAFSDANGNSITKPKGWSAELSSGQNNKATFKIPSLTSGVVGYARITAKLIAGAQAGSTIVNGPFNSSSGRGYRLTSDSLALGTVITGESVYTYVVGSLELLSTVTPTTAFAGGRLTYTLTYRNLGSSAVTEARISNALASGVSVSDRTSTSSVLAANGSISRDGRTVSFALGKVAAGASGTKTFSVSIDSTTQGQVVNRADFTAKDAAGKSQLVSSQVTATILRGASVTLRATGTPAKVKPGEVITYVIEATNAGDAAVSQINIANLLPIHTAFEQAFLGTPDAPRSGTTPIRAFDTTTGRERIIWQLGSLGAGERQSVTLRVRVVYDLSTPATITNDTYSALLSNGASVTGEPVITQVTGKAVEKLDLNLFKTVATPDNSAVVQPGDILTYSLRLVNNGPTTARRVRVIEPRPFLVSNNQALSVQEISDNGVQTSNGIIWELGDLPEDAIRTLTFKAIAPQISKNSDTIRNIGHSVLTDSLIKSVPGNKNLLGVQTPVDVKLQNRPTLSLALSDQNAVARPGQDLTLYVIFGNLVGGGNARNTNLRVTLPYNTTFVSGQLLDPSTYEPRTSFPGELKLPPVGTLRGTVVHEAKEFPFGTELLMRIIVRVDSNISRGTNVLTTTATFTSDNATNKNLSTSIGTKVEFPPLQAAHPWLHITGPSSAVSGQPFKLYLTYGNSGEEQAEDLEIELVVSCPARKLRDVQKETEATLNPGDTTQVTYNYTITVDGDEPVSFTALPYIKAKGFKKTLGQRQAILVFPTAASRNQMLSVPTAKSSSEVSANGISDVFNALGQTLLAIVYTTGKALTNVTNFLTNNAQAVPAKIKPDIKLIRPGSGNTSSIGLDAITFLNGVSLVRTGPGTVIVTGPASLIGNDGGTLIAQGDNVRYIGPSSGVRITASALIGNDGSTFTNLATLTGAQIIDNIGKGNGFDVAALRQGDQVFPAARLIRGGAGLIGNDGSTLIGNDGSTLRSLAGTTLVPPSKNALIGNDGSTFVSNKGGALIGNDGSTTSPLIGNDGSTLLDKEAQKLIGNDGGTLISNDGSTLKEKTVAQFSGGNGMGITALIGNDGST